MYAVIRTGGKQYRVAETDLLEIERLGGEAGESVAFGEVLMVGGEAGVTIGTPLVAGATVAGEIVEHRRSAKILILKKRRRKNSKRRRGHRQDHTLVRITEILTGGATPTKTQAKAAPKAAPAEPAPAKATKPKATAKPQTDAVPAAEPKPAKAAESSGDDLKKLTGVGPAIEKKLHALGVTSFAAIAAWTDEDVARVEEALNIKGRIRRDNWVAEAKQFLAEKK